MCVYIYISIYMYIYTGSRFGSPSLPPPKMVWYPCRPPKIHHLHAICSISESRPPICFQFAAFQSHNLRLASYLQHLKAICYLHTTYVPFIGLSTVYVSFLPGIPIHKPSHSVSTYCSLVAYYWYITCVVYPYIYIYYYCTCSVAIRHVHNEYRSYTYIHTIIYNIYSYATSKNTRPHNPPPQGGGGNHINYLIQYTYI